jgi:Fic family protein
MQIVSNRYGVPTIFFEAPPSDRIFHEMTLFMDWFNATEGCGSILLRAALSHVYFESIHPFEDGNGRIGRILVEKILSQGIGQPLLITVSKILEKKKKEYYAELGRCNSTLDIQNWIEFFSDRILEAQEVSLHLLYFLMEKAKMFGTLSGQINSRQEKVLLRKA